MKLRDVRNLELVIQAIEKGEPPEKKRLNWAKIALAREREILEERSRRKREFFSQHPEYGYPH